MGKTWLFFPCTVTLKQSALLPAVLHRGRQWEMLDRGCEEKWKLAVLCRLTGMGCWQEKSTPKCFKITACSRFCWDQIMAAEAGLNFLKVRRNWMQTGRQVVWGQEGFIFMINFWRRNQLWIICYQQLGNVSSAFIHVQQSYKPINTSKKWMNKIN